MRIVLSVAPVFLFVLLLLFAAHEFLFLLSLPYWPFNCAEFPSR